MNGRNLMLVRLTICAVFAVPETAQACTVAWVPFSEQIRHLSAGEIAVRARPEISFSVFEEFRWAGTIHLRKIRCIKPHRVSCPQTIDIELDGPVNEGTCESAIEVSLRDARPDKPSRMRYFFLGKDERGGWILHSAERRYY